VSSATALASGHLGVGGGGFLPLIFIGDHGQPKQSAKQSGFSQSTRQLVADDRRTWD
jgi:hypothetical protein